jgi:chorismate mutase
LGDAAQQVTPTALKKIFVDLKVRELNDVSDGTKR